jgi:hypothetical protein
MTTRLSIELLRLFSQGELSGQQVQTLAFAGWSDGWGRGDVLAERLASAGDFGKYTGNIVRDIMKAAHLSGWTINTARPYIVQLPNGGHTRVFLPHEVLAKLVTGPNASDWCLSAAALEAPRGLGPLLRDWAVHEDVQFTGALTGVSIVGIHCDGVQYTSSMRAGGAKSIIVASMNVISGQSQALRHQRQPLFVLQKSKLCDCGCQGYHTIQAVWDVLAWSFRCLLQGLSPTRRHDGSPFSMADRQGRMSGGLPIPPAALLQVRGDWEWLVSCCRLRSFKSDRFCWMCNTTQAAGIDCYENFDPNAHHRQTMLSHEDYVQSCIEEAAEISNVFRCPGTLLQHLGVDSMHAGDLGIFQDAIGSLLWLECTNKVVHRSNAVGLAILNKDINTYYAANSDRKLSRATPLVWSQLFGEKPGYPYLKAKAAETRHLCDFALLLAQRHKHGDANHAPFVFKANNRMAPHQQTHLDAAVAMSVGLCRYHDSCSALPFDEETCKAALYMFLQNFKILHDLWRTDLPEDLWRHLPFHMRPKAHVLQHLVEDKVGMWGSPSEFWCYRDEDYIGVVKGIARKTKHPSTIEKRILEKMMIWTKVSAHQFE